MLSPAARIHLPKDWQGTAEELAATTSRFLADCGFDAKFFCTERLVRYYLSRGVLTAPDKDPVDRRKALFGNLQFRQLVLTRLLAERGWDLERVQSQLIGFKGPKSVNELNDLLNQLAEPTPAEQLLFQSRRDSPDPCAEPVFFRQSQKSLSQEADDRIDVSSKSTTNRSEREQQRSNMPRQFIQAARDDVTLHKLALLAEKVMADSNLPSEELRALRELAEMARLASRSGAKKERWTRLKLAPWCEINLRISGEVDMNDELKYYMLNEFRRILDNYDSAL